jgi:two-component system, NarL family, invasion response regulator UvrY
MIKVLLADDHYVVRKGLKQILSHEKDISVVGEASNSEEIFSQQKNIYWDVIVLDIALPGKNGLDILIRLKGTNPESKVLMLSMYKDPEVVLRALRTGADGYLNKDSAPEELVHAVKEIWKGKRYIGSTIDLEDDSGFDDSSCVNLHSRLSYREFQVLCLIASGYSLKQIAADLSVNIKTVSTYRSRILEKLNVKTNVELVHYAVKHKLILTV